MARVYLCIHSSNSLLSACLICVQNTAEEDTKVKQSGRIPGPQLFLSTVALLEALEIFVSRLYFGGGGKELFAFVLFFCSLSRL